MITVDMKIILTIIITFSHIVLLAQDQSHNQEIKLFQKELNEEFLNPDKTPLSEKELSKFKELNFYPINKSLRFEAKFKRIHNPVSFQMKTTTNKTPTYDKYGEAIFEFEGKKYKLSIYQSHRLRQTEKYKNYLFLPFADLTSGEETYGGGRYIDLRVPSGEIIIIDFNKAYNPFCAYNYKYSCPIPPKENILNLRIEAGVKN